MALLEILINIGGVLLLLTSWVKLDFGWAYAIILTLIVLQLFLTPWRWQMLPFYMAFLGMFAAFYWQFDVHIIIKLVGFVFAFLLTLLSVFLSHYMPLIKLSKPTGHYDIGTVSAAYERRDGDEVRHLFAKIWYPASGEYGHYKRDGIWSEFYKNEKFPAVVRYLALYLKNIKTHSYIEMPFLTAKKPYPVIIYNHALISIAADNNRLLEGLASRGYVVLSVRHEEQDVEYKRIQAGLSDAEKAMDKQLLSILAKDEISQEKRAELTLQQIQNSSGMAGIVMRRAADSQFMLDKLGELLGRVGAVDENVIDLQNVGAIGLSVGGGVATELGRTDNRIKAVVNLDGGVFSATPLALINVPYLMMYSEFNNGSMDFLEPVTHAGFETHMIAGAQHLNYHDVGSLLPIMKFMGAVGKISGEEVFTQSTQIVVEFFAKYMPPSE
ncbi:MAG: hypothetical protein COC24_004010 [Alphaproteobacteria bacterium]|nr:hypothetical protein [Alphaproteobacteria bacterium]